MNRIAVFAHFDKNNQIKNYVIYYLKELKKVTDKIIFVSDCDLNHDELSKIESLTEHIIAHKHGEYDFGSYKKGYIYAKDNKLLDNCEELIFANDSCYAPLYPFEELWKSYPAKADFWGININDYNALHIQSFFLVFKPTVFNSEYFDFFIRNIKPEKTKQNIIEKYEIGLSQLLIKNGVRLAAIFQTPIDQTYKSSFLYQKRINPLIKVRSFSGLSKIFVFITCKFLFHRHKIKYPIKYILENINTNFFSMKDWEKSLKFLNIHTKKLGKFDNSADKVVPFNINSYNG